MSIFFNTGSFFSQVSFGLLRRSPYSICIARDELSNTLILTFYDYYHRFSVYYAALKTIYVYYQVINLFILLEVILITT